MAFLFSPQLPNKPVASYFCVMGFVPNGKMGSLQCFHFMNWGITLSLELTVTA